MKHNAYTLTGKPCRFAAIATGLLAGWAMASADVAVRIEVRGSGPISSKRSGTYEIDYSGRMARLVGPDGTVRLIDLRSLHVARIDPVAKTYTIEPMFLSAQSGWAPSEGIASPALHIVLDANAGSKSIAGLPARHLMLTSTTGTKWSGDGWIADMTSWQTRPSSVSPLLMTALTADVGRDIANQYDQAYAFPLVLTLSNGESGTKAESVTLTVSSVQEIPLKPESFSIPDGYREVDGK